VAFGDRVGEGFGPRRKRFREFRQQRPQHAGDRAERPERGVADRAKRFQDGPVGEGFPQRLARAGEHAAAAELPALADLREQPGAAHARLALDEDRGRALSQHVDDGVELGVAAGQPGGSGPDGNRGGAGGGQPHMTLLDTHRDQLAGA